MDPCGTYVWSPQITLNFKSWSQFISLAKAQAADAQIHQILFFNVDFVSSYVVYLFSYLCSHILAGKKPGEFCQLSSVIWGYIAGPFLHIDALVSLCPLKMQMSLRTTQHSLWENSLFCLQQNCCVFNRATRLSVSFHTNLIMISSTLSLSWGTGNLIPKKPFRIMISKSLQGSSPNGSE